MKQIVEVDFLGNLDEIQKNYYLNQINRLPKDEQLKARKLVEEGLIYAEDQRRISLYENQILRDYSLSVSTLQILVDTHLLRIEPDPKGGYNYEISHDSLINPILQAYTNRLEEEAKAQQKIEAERRRQEEIQNEIKRKLVLRRQHQIILIISITAIISLSLSVITFVQYRIAHNKQAEAHQALISAYNSDIKRYQSEIEVLKRNIKSFERFKADDLAYLEKHKVDSLRHIIHNLRGKIEAIK